MEQVERVLRPGQLRVDNSPSDYRPRGPLELTSKRYAKDVAEVQAYGRVDSTVRTAKQVRPLLLHRRRDRVASQLLRDEAREARGGLHYRTTMKKSARHFPRIARDVGRQYFLADAKDKDDD